MLLVFLLSVGLFWATADADCSTDCGPRVGRLSARMTELETQLNTLDATIGGASGYGAIYKRWGRKTCPDQSSLIYEGFVAGSHYTHIGGGANYLCMPLDPEFENVKDGTQSNGGFIYGAEYEICNADILSKENQGTDKLHDQDVPCAVCEATKRQSEMFIAAKTECPAGWTLEYSGYVMGSHVAHHRAEWVCMDKAPETRDHGMANQNGVLFYFAEAKCGSLPCPPYSDGNEIPCVVCTK